ncbi:MAG: zinc-dependent alcohol dehydrogenase family protein [Chloroflexi bacterium]|nr:zinc-dependent alcohol dehydrogenase family protein [Chloroflexota bacterium]
MRAAIFNGPGDITVGERPNPVIQDPTDAIVRVTLACVCGSDLWYYRGESKHEPGAIGHEFIGIVEAVGSAVTTLAEGDFVVAPFLYSDGTCELCLAGWPAHCLSGGGWGNATGGGQGERVRVPLADGTLLKVPGTGHSDDVLRSLLALSDVMCTGYHAAVSGGVREGSTVAVVGDGAVGLSAVLAAKRLGAERIIALSRNPARQDVAREFGATDIIAERGDAAVEAVKGLTSGLGVEAALECVGTGESLDTAFKIARSGGMVGAVGVPHDSVVPIETVIFRNVGLRGGVAPARKYIPELLGDVLDGSINPGLVFDFETDLEHTPEAYAAMDERRAIKSLIRVGAA